MRCCSACAAPRCTASRTCSTRAASRRLHQPLGYGERELFGNHLLFGRAVYYRRLGESDSLFSVPTYVGGSLEAGNVFATRADVDVQSLILAGSIFVGVDTFLGPIFLGYGASEDGHTSWYLNFGSLLRPRL